MTYDDKLKQELNTYDNNTHIHDLPDIYNYWTYKYLKPIGESCGISQVNEFFVDYMLASAKRCQTDKSLFASIGSGNCDIEIEIIQLLRQKGLKDFSIECIEINANMLDRGYQLAKQLDLLDYISFSQMDINQWRSHQTYSAIMANQSLHHIQNLEGLFATVKATLHQQGSFVVSDMIGRNGHQRWPEALAIVQDFWRQLPDKYKYNHQLQRHEADYINWDCSSEGFEGIRAQDILPLLLQQFNFELFIGFSNVIDVFIDRGFGHNFDVNNPLDTDFIDKVHACDERAIRQGQIKPTHMVASMRKTAVDQPLYSRGLSPEFCVREVTET